MNHTDEVVMSSIEFVTSKEEAVRLNHFQLKENEIIIRFLSRGMIIRVGCKEIPFETIDKGMAALNDYVANPREEADKWIKILK
jgi:hypothetical protein